MTRMAMMMVICMRWKSEDFACLVLLINVVVWFCCE